MGTFSNGYRAQPVYAYPSIDHRILRLPNNMPTMPLKVDFLIIGYMPHIASSTSVKSIMRLRKAVYNKHERTGYHLLKVVQRLSVFRHQRDSLFKIGQQCHRLFYDQRYSVVSAFKTLKSFEATLAQHLYSGAPELHY